MARATLEQRVAALEEKMNTLMAAQMAGKRVKDWRRTSGAFSGDEVMKQIFEEGRKIREAERKLAKRHTRR